MALTCLKQPFLVRETGQIQAGYMQQHSNAVNKGQIQLSLHYSF
jgi:hypothetical protein